MGGKSLTFDILLQIFYTNNLLKTVFSIRNSLFSINVSIKTVYFLFQKQVLIGLLKVICIENNIFSIM